MLQDFACPICAGAEWCAGRVYVYAQEITCKSQEQQIYWQLRRRVLYRLWLPSEEQPRLTSLCCRRCGFMCYSPRPEETDLGAKYRFLSEHESIGAPHTSTRRARQLEAKRARTLFRLIRNHYHSSVQSVLDAGGGDGRLLLPFVGAGVACYVLDYNPKPVEGVIRLGSTPEELPPDSSFDAIICSHVLEHVSSPGKFLTRLRAALAPGGLIYVEVPLEIWRDIPIDVDPVTHVNFFTADSLKTLLQLNGFCPLNLQSIFAPYGERYKRVVRGVARLDTCREASLRPSRAFAMLSPDVFVRTLRVAENCWLHGVLNFPVTIRSIFGTDARL